MEKLYAEYGELMVQMEILNGRIGDVKRRIAESINEKVEKKDFKGEA